MSNKMLQRAFVYDAQSSAAPLSVEKRLVLERVGSGKRVLEIGAHTGFFSSHLAHHRCQVTAVELDVRAAAKAESRAERVIIGDIEDTHVQRQISGPFDCILFMHVLEHLVNPWRVLKESHAWLDARGSLIALLPNVACWRARKELFFRGAFDYTETGLMDRTHLRFFTLRTARELLESSDYEILDWISADTCVPLHRRMSSVPGLKMLASPWYRWMSCRYPNLCSEILLFQAVPTRAREIK